MLLKKALSVKCQVSNILLSKDDYQQICQVSNVMLSKNDPVIDNGDLLHLLF